MEVSAELFPAFFPHQEVGTKLGQTEGHLHQLIVEREIVDCQYCDTCFLDGLEGDVSDFVHADLLTVGNHYALNIPILSKELMLFKYFLLGNAFGNFSYDD